MREDGSLTLNDAAEIVAPLPKGWDDENKAEERFFSEQDEANFQAIMVEEQEPHSWEETDGRD